MMIVVASTVALAKPLPKGWKRCQFSLPGSARTTGSIDFPVAFHQIQPGQEAYLGGTEKRRFLIALQDGPPDAPEKFPEAERKDTFGSAFRKGFFHGWDTTLTGSTRTGYFLGAFANWRSYFVQYSRRPAANFKLSGSKLVQVNGWKGELQSYSSPPASGRTLLLLHHGVAVQVVVFENGPPSKEGQAFIDSLTLPRL
ncbi:hypothetical protein ABS71_16370 [bacterium SCN 62-11]|nr:MAG: hypothetical protein ABS71_16370 [bacterium SCN 62-11]